MTDVTNSVFTQMIKAMQVATEGLAEGIDLAAADIGKGRRNGAIGALAGVDEHLESLAALISAIRVMHRNTPL